MKGRQKTPNEGIEPSTTRLRVVRSANWANSAILCTPNDIQFKIFNLNEWLSCRFVCSDMKETTKISYDVYDDGIRIDVSIKTEIFQYYLPLPHFVFKTTTKNLGKNSYPTTISRLVPSLWRRWVSSLRIIPGAWYILKLISDEEPLNETNLLSNDIFLKLCFVNWRKCSSVWMCNSFCRLHMVIFEEWRKREKNETNGIVCRWWWFFTLCSQNCSRQTSTDVQFHTR